MTPETIDRYEIKQELGRGGMATVYEAYDPRFQRTVAVKVLPREFTHEPEFRARFTREARTIAQLEHPAIVPVYDFGESSEGQPFLVMRLMTGGSLADRLAQGPLPIEEVATILQRLGSALDAAHNQGIVHRDMKPSNILFDQYGEAYLADFGIAHIASSSSALTASGSLVGTPTYMSPEQVYGDKQLDGRSDIYALGIILFQMLTGRLPYDADTPARVMMKHVMDPVPPILDDRPDLPVDFDEIIHKAMAKEREERFPTAHDLSTALNEATKRTSQADLHAELAAVRTELNTSPPARATAETAEPVTPSRPPAAEPETTPQPPLLPTTDSITQSERRSGVPVWVWGLVGLFVVVCLGSIIGTFFLLANRDDESVNAETATAVARADIQATREALVAVVITETAVPASPQPEATAEPSATPEPEEPDPTEAPEERPDDDTAATRESLAATRESLAATRAASNNTEPTPEPVSSGDFDRILSNDLAPIYGPSSDEIPHELDDIIELVYIDDEPQNFVASARIGNPFAASENEWDFGYIFRQAEADDEMRFVVRSDGLWTLNDRTPDTDNFLAEGDASRLLNVGEEDENVLELIAAGDAGYAFLNGEFVSTLDLSSRDAGGNLALGTGFYLADEQEGAATPYDSFTTWEIEPVYGPETGAMDHVLDDLIKVSTADVALENFILSTTFVNPFSADELAWDLGFGFRDTGSIYWLVLESSGDWVLVYREGDADTDRDVQWGTVENLDTSENGRNQLTLIVWGDKGYFFINGAYVDTLDLADHIDAGDAGVITAFYPDHEIEGRATGYEDFTIWELP